VPDNAHMNRLWPDRRTMDTVLLPTGAPAARLVPVAVWARRAARRTIGYVRGLRATAAAGWGRTARRPGRAPYGAAARGFGRTGSGRPDVARAVCAQGSRQAS